MTVLISLGLLALLFFGKPLLYGTWPAVVHSSCLCEGATMSCRLYGSRLSASAFRVADVTLRYTRSQLEILAAVDGARRILAALEALAASLSSRQQINCPKCPEHGPVVWPFAQQCSEFAAIRASIVTSMKSVRQPGHGWSCAYPRAFCTAFLGTWNGDRMYSEVVERCAWRRVRTSLGWLMLAV